MKKLVSTVVVLAMVLAMLPMMVLATGSNSYDVAVGFGQYIDLCAEDQVTLVVDAQEKDVLLTVNGEGTYFDWYIDNGMQQFIPDMSGSYKLNLAAGKIYELLLVSETAFDDQMLYVSLTAPEVGTEENPAEVTLGENSISVDGITPYFFGYTATEAGNLTVSVDTAKCSDWSFQLTGNLANGTKKIGDTNYSDLEPVVSTETVAVNPGDVYMICVSTANWGSAGTIYFSASFTPGTSSEEGSEGNEGGEGTGEVIGSVVASETVKVNSESGLTDDSKYKVIEFTAQAEGMMYITMSSSEKGWSLLVYKNEEALTWMMTGSSAETFSYPVKSGDVMKFQMGAYDPVVAWAPVDGSITYAISFDAGEVEIQKETYIISDTFLYVGDNDLTMIENAENTLFEFTPDQTGIYVFTAPAGILLGDWGQFFNPMDHSGDNKTNTIEWTCTDVGQSILIGVAGEENVVLNVERTGDYVPAPVVEWTEYEIKAKLDYFELSGDEDFLTVDVTDDIADSAVLGTDGFYHLNSATGPILFIDMNQYVYPAAGYGNVGYIVYDDEGNVVQKINYTNAVFEYYTYTDSGIYPLTEDMIEIYKNYGTAQGWYRVEDNGFYLFGEDVVDPETAWMFACYYDEDLTAFLSDYYVAGEAGLCGSTWTPGDEANQMVMNADGTCSITYTDVAPGKYMFKVTQTDWNMDNWGGDGPDGNYVFELGSKTYVTITFDPATGLISVATGENTDTSDYSVAAMVVAVMAATAGAVVLTKKKEF